jgi:P4 family phage/plasmid primase-like protien
MPNEFDELVDLPQDTIGAMTPQQQQATHTLDINQETLNVSIRAKVEKSLAYKEDKETGVMYPIGIMPQQATDNFVNEIPIIAHPTLGIPYEYNAKTGLWKGITAPLNLHIDRFYLEQWFYQESLESAKVFYDRKKLAMELSNLKLLEGEETPINSEPNPNKILFKNGAYDFETNTIVDPQIDDYHTLQLPYDLVPTNERTIAEDWLEWVLGDNLQTVMELIGYSFYRKYQYATLTYFVNDPKKSSGANGKSQVLNYISHVLGGRNNVSSVQLEKLSTKTERFSSSQLQHKLANIDADSGTEYLTDTGVLKSLTGGDLIQAERKGKDPFQFVNYAKLLFSTNKLPKFSDNSYGLERRLIVIPFEKEFKDGQHKEMMEFYNRQRKEREDYTSETIGKFVWNCLQAFRAILEDPERVGLPNPFYKSTLAKELTKSYIDNNNIINIFLKDNDLEVTGDPNDRMEQSDVKAIYETWKDDSEATIKWLNFKKRLQEIGVEFKQARIGLEHGTTKNTKCLLGIKRKGE